MIQAIYTFNIRLLVLRLLPPVLRKARMTAWFVTLLSPLLPLQATARAAHEANLKRASYPSSRLAAEALINDLHDANERRIKLVNSASLQQDTYIYLFSENQQDSFIYFKSESPATGELYVFENFSTDASQFDLTIEVPDLIFSKKDAIESTVKEVVPLGVRYGFKIINLFIGPGGGGSL